MKNYNKFLPWASLVGIMTLALPAQAATVYSNDFSANANGFSGGSIETSPSGEKYLANFQGSTTTLTISGLAANSGVSLNFTLDVVNSLDGGPAGVIGGGPGDFFNVVLNGTNIFSNTFANYGNGETQTYGGAGSGPGTGASGYNTLGTVACCGGQQYGDTIYNLSLTGFANGAGVAQFVFNDASNEAYDNEHYGIDNVVVDGTRVNSVPGPIVGAGLPGLVMAFGGIVAWRRRRAALAA